MGHPEPILHVDMDAFFASVEQRDDPSLQGLPVVVGGSSGRGVVAAASYEARRFGIHSAMPMVRARRLCADLRIIAPRFDAYQEASRAVLAILRDVTPLVEPLSLDEAFLDVTGATRLFGAPPQIGEMIREQIRGRVDLPSSVGVGPTKSVAKLLSGRAKPDGLAHWPVDEVAARLRPLPVSALWGAGPKTVERLTRFGYRTVGAIADADPVVLRRIVGASLADHLAALAVGHDPRPVQPREAARSVSAEQTFEHDIDDPTVMARHVQQLAQKVARRLRAANLAGRTVTLKVRLAPFETLTRSTTVAAPTDTTHDVVRLATGLLTDLDLERRPVRLLGVGVSNLGEDTSPRQLTLASVEDDGGDDARSAAAAPTDPRWERVDQVADSIAARFAGVEVSYASLLDEQTDAGPRDGQTDDGPSDDVPADDVPGDRGPSPG